MLKLPSRRPLFVAVLSLALFAIAPHSRAASTTNWQNRPDFIAFNSLTDNPSFGNEKDFLRVRSLANNDFADVLKVNGPQELVVQLYYDNNATRASQVARNSVAKISLPDTPANDVTIKAFISADNAKPQAVSDSVRVISDSPVKLTYESGSAQIWSNVWRGKSVNDSLMADGTPLGFARLDGNVPGGPHYSGYLTAKVRVAIIKETPALKAPTAPGANGITNTGPGDVVGLFAGSSALGTTYHLIRTARRSRR